MSTHRHLIHAEALARAGWDEVLDRILAGVGHDIMNRVQSMAGLVQLLQIGDDVETTAGYMEEEVNRLEQAALRMRLIPGEPGADAELVHVPDLVEDLMALHAVQRYLEPVDRTVEVELEGLLPIRAPLALLIRTLLVLLAAGGWAALARERRVHLRIFNGGGGAVSLEVEVPGDPREADLPPESGRRDGLPTLAQLLGGAYGDGEEDGGLRLKLTLPSAVVGGGGITT